MPATQSKKPSDFTGRQSQILAKQNAAALAARASELSTVQAAEAEEIETTVLDVTQSPEQPQVIEADAIVLSEEHKLMRVNEDLESVTFGAGNHYTFAVGREYRVPKTLYDHLDERGYVWH